MDDIWQIIPKLSQTTGWISKALGLSKVGTCRRRCYVWVPKVSIPYKWRIPFVDLHDFPWRELHFLLDDFRKRFPIHRIKIRFVRHLFGLNLWWPIVCGSLLVFWLPPQKKRQWKTGTGSVEKTRTTTKARGKGWGGETLECILGRNGVKIKGDQGILLWRLYFYDVSRDTHHSSGFCHLNAFAATHLPDKVTARHRRLTSSTSRGTYTTSAECLHGERKGETWIFHEFCWLPWGWEGDYQSLAGGSCFFVWPAVLFASKVFCFIKRNWTFDEFCHVSYMELYDVTCAILYFYSKMLISIENNLCHFCCDMRMRRRLRFGLDWDLVSLQLSSATLLPAGTGGLVPTAALLLWASRGHIRAPAAGRLAC